MVTANPSPSQERSASTHCAHQPAHTKEVGIRGDSALTASQRSAMPNGAILQGIRLNILAAASLCCPPS